MATQSYLWLEYGATLVNNVVKAGSQTTPAITALADGSGYFTTWDTSSSSPIDVGGRLFDSNGSPVTSETPVNSTTSNDQFDSSIATLANGNIVVTYTDTSTDAGGNIRARLLTSSGEPIGSDFTVTVSTKADSESDVAALADGGFVVTWTTVFG